MSFADLAASLTRKAALIARSAGEARLAEHRREGARWHSARLLWPLFARRSD